MPECHLKPSTSAVVSKYVSLLEPLIESGWNVVLQSKNKGKIVIDSEFSVCRFFEKEGALHSIYIQLGVSIDGGGTIFLSESDITNVKPYYCKAKIKHINLDDFNEDFVTELIGAYKDCINLEVVNTHGFTYLGFGLCDTMLFSANQGDTAVTRVKIAYNNYEKAWHQSSLIRSKQTNKHLKGRI